MKVIVLLGAPGSGKGTIASRLSRRYPVCHVSSGDLLRAAVRQADTPAARAAAENMRKGELVDDETVGALVNERLLKCDPSVILLLDGYPRNVRQAAALETEAVHAGASVAAAVWLDVPESVLVSRLAGRRVCGGCAANYHVTNLPPRVAGVCDACGAALIQREDDRPERVANRLVVYREQTAALIEWYASRGLLVRIEAAGDAEETATRVARAVMA